MITDFVFIDKTLEYALKNKQIDANKFVMLKDKIAEMSNMIFDVSMDFLKANQVYKNIDSKNVRICIDPTIEQVKAAYRSGCSWIRLSLNCSSGKEKQYSLRKALAEANKLNLKVTVGCIDIAEKSRLGIDSIQKLISEFKIYSVIVHDYHSGLDPLATYAALEGIKARVDCNLEYDGKNSLGLATGNALGAIKSGIYIVTASVGGIGGFPAFEEVVMSMRHLLKISVPVPQNIARCCKEVLEYIDVDTPKTKPVIGSNIFAHESGIHVDGVIKKSELYEPFTPEEVGLSRKIVIGKHSGRAAVEQKVKELNMSMDPSCIALLLERVRSLAIKQKAAVVDEQLQQLVKEVTVYEGACC